MPDDRCQQFSKVFAIDPQASAFPIQTSERL